MTYDLVIGDRAYSSWSLRGWLLFDAFSIPVKPRLVRLYTDELATALRDYVPARTVPTMRTPDGSVVTETIAIAEELATRHPEAGIWPTDPHARATARVLAAEMHAGFTALRSHCPMNLRVSCTDCAPPTVGRWFARKMSTVPPMPSLPRWQQESPPTTCPSGPRRWPMSPPTSPTRPF